LAAEISAGPYEHVVPEHILQGELARVPIAAEATADTPALSPREQEVLDLIARGLTHAQAASRMGEGIHPRPDSRGGRHGPDRHRPGAGTYLEITMPLATGQPRTFTP
jgi:hypothetical protein